MKVAVCSEHGKDRFTTHDQDLDMGTLKAKANEVKWPHRTKNDLWGIWGKPTRFQSAYIKKRHCIGSN
jgi:hypothetical protein